MQRRPSDFEKHCGQVRESICNPLRARRHFSNFLKNAMSDSTHNRGIVFAISVGTSETFEIGDCFKYLLEKQEGTLLALYHTGHR